LKQNGSGDDDAVQALLHTMLAGILRRSFAAEGSGSTATATPGPSA
jgi:hypothetical protein